MPLPCLRPDSLLSVVSTAIALLPAAAEVAALALKRLRADNAAGPLLVFDNATGRTRDFDTRGSDEELLARVTEAFPL